MHDKEKVFVVQSAGLGDNIFSQTSIKKYANGREIIWGSKKEYLSGLKIAYPSVTWILDTESGIDYNRKDFYFIGNMEVIPLRWSDSLVGLGYKFCMASKYSLLKQHWRTWKKDAAYVRDPEKEDFLIDLLGIRDKKFTLVNSNFWTIGKGKRINQIPKIEGRVVEMREIEGFSLFDWSKVMEMASEIHSVSTSTLYLFELLDLKCPIHLYPRIPHEQDFKNVEYIFSKEYVLH